MGALIAKPKHDSSGSLYSPHTAHLGIGPDGILRDPCIEGILNLENRQVNNEAFAKISSIHQVTRQVLSLSLANNRITSLVFDETTCGPSSKSHSQDHPPLMTQSQAAVRQSSDGSVDANRSHLQSVEDEDDLNEREGSVQRSTTLHSTPAKPLPASTVPLRSSTNWPMLENLDLSGNNELFNYVGLGTVTATLRSLRLANNGIFKVPKEVWALTNLTKLDLSHNRLLVLPPGISLLVKLNSLKLAHNSLASTGSTSCIPEEMKFCSRLRRLDLSHNKLRELPVNWRADRENQRKSILKASGHTTPLLTAAAAAHAVPALTSAAANRNSNANNEDIGLPPTHGLNGGAGFSKTAASTHGTQNSDGSPRLHSSAANSSSASSYSAAPIPIKYFDPNRISYIQITLLNLSNNQMDSLSPSIGLLRSLNSLNLGYNKLRSLPTEIALLAELKYLDLRFNQLPSLLTEICQLPRLSKLCLQNNKISALPYEIRKLKKLTHFFISSNQLVDLPDVIVEIRNVRVLKLCNNKLLTIPDSMFRLQKLRLLDLSFNKLTYLSPDVCTMPLIEDLRLWGNKLSDIPTPILYSDVKKIISYLRATERERHLIAHQMRSLQGPRSFSRLSVKSTPRADPARAGRAMSATRATSSDDRRFAPLGFYDDREDDSTLAGGGHRSLASAPSRPVGGSGVARKGEDSGSENEDMGSDDEFTSMFRAAHSRTGSFTNLAAGQQFEARSASAGNSSRRSTVHRSPAASPGISGSPRDSHSNTIVQPFSNQHQFALAGGIMSGSSNSSSSSVGLDSVVSMGHAGLAPASSHRGGSTLRSIQDHADLDEEEEGEDGDELEEGVGKATDVLTDMVRREWNPHGNGGGGARLDLPSPAMCSNTNNAGLSQQTIPTMGGARHAAADEAVRSLAQPAEALMEEWDMQSQAIEKQQTGAKGTGRGRIGANK